MEKNFFKTLDTEIDTQIPLKGSLPNWLEGVLLRNGPAKFEQGERPLKHWFDGYAMLHKFVVRGGKVWYNNKFLHSNCYNFDHSQHGITTLGTGTIPNPCRSIFGKFFNLFKPVPLDNNNVSIIDFNDKFFAVSDYSRLIEFDIHTLETKGEYKFNDEIGDKFMLSCAHPSIDPHTSEMYNFLCEVGPTVKYYLTCIDMTTGLRSLVSKFTRPYPVLIHSTALTPNYYIMIECPAKVDFWDLFLGEFRNKPFCEAIAWHKETPTRFHIVHRRTHKVTVLESESFFFFHTMNAFERDGNICIDLCHAQHGDLLRDYYLEKLIDEGLSAANLMKPARFTLNLAKKQVSWEYLNQEFMELPQINHNKVATKSYQYAYGLGMNMQISNDMYNQMIKIEVETGKHWIWQEDGMYPSEPIFVANPENKREDQGVILSVVLDNTGMKSFLLVLDAETFTEIARAEVPHLIPMGIHGKFFDYKNILDEFDKQQLEKLQLEGFQTRRIYEM